MMKEDDNEKNFQKDIDLYNNIDNNNTILNTQLMSFDNININNNNIINNKKIENNFNSQQIDINNIIKTNNFFQINFAINKSNENEQLFLNNFINTIQSSQNKNNQNLKSQITIQDLNAINSIINGMPNQKIENSFHYLQIKILQNPIYANEILYPFLYPYMITLLNDQFGNYIYQSFIEILNTKNLYHFLFEIKNNFKEISSSKNGTRVIQKLIEKSTTIKQENNFIQKSLIEMLKGKIFELSIDENANHIVQKFLINIQYPYNNFIYEELYKNFMYIAITKYGCCVIQKSLINGNKEQKEKIVYLILQNTFCLITNQFGNYVYQCILMLKDEKINYKIIEIIYDKIIPLCKEKYSSNVIEKILDINNPILVNQLIEDITKNENKILELLTNKYGNYIIQKILNISHDKKLIFRILNIIAKNILIINNAPFGKKLICKLIEKYPILTDFINSREN